MGMGLRNHRTEAPAGDFAGRSILELLTPHRAPLHFTRVQIEATNAITTRRFLAARRLAAIVDRIASKLEAEPAPSEPWKAKPRSSRPAPPAKAERSLPELMTTEEACSYFECCPKTLTRWRKRCPEIAIMPMGRWRYYRDRLAALVDATVQVAEDDLGDFIKKQIGRPK
jgi:hypothetical protein